MAYTYGKTVAETREKDDLEKLVTERELWCLEWDWIRQFQVSYPKRSGPFQYVSKNAFKGVHFTTFSAEKGKIHVQADTSLEALLINRVFIYAEEQNPPLF